MKNGIASLYVMLIFIAASVIAAGLLERQHLELVRTANFVDDMQMMEYAQSGEDFARQIIYDYIQNLRDDTPKPLVNIHPGLQVAGGQIEITIEDLGGRFNINSLTGDSQDAPNYFRALCSELKIDDKNVDVLLTHISATAQSKPAATPSSTTAQATPNPAPNDTATAPATAQQAIFDISEIMDMGFPADSYGKIRPFITALSGNSAEININAASDTLLKAYLLNNTQIESVRSAIAQDGYIGKDTLSKLNIPATSITTGSKTFAIHTRVTLSGRSMTLNSTLIVKDANAQNPTTQNQPPVNAANTSSPGAEGKSIAIIKRVWGEEG